MVTVMEVEMFDRKLGGRNLRSTSDDSSIDNHLDSSSVTVFKILKYINDSMLS